MDAFISEIRLMSFDRALPGWAPCNGQLLPIAQNQALFAVIGTRFGGDGTNNFALPDLRARVPMHRDADHAVGMAAGEEKHALELSEIPAHTHAVNVLSTTAASSDIPAADLLLAQASQPLYRQDAAQLAAMDPGVLDSSGDGEPHDNMQPYLVLNFCIALEGAPPPAAWGPQPRG